LERSGKAWSDIMNNTPETDITLQVMTSCNKHRAAWLGLIYDEAQKDGFAEKIEQYMMAATYRYGLMSGSRMKARMTADPVDCEELAIAMGKNDHRGKALGAVVEQSSPERIDLAYHHCPLLDSWKEWGLDDAVCQKLCRIAMNSDVGVAKALGLQFDLYETLADGVPCCKCSYYHQDA